MNDPDAAEVPANQRTSSQVTPSSAPSEHTYILDSEQAAELARLMQQDRLLTEAMGGLLPEEGISLPETGRVLDLACGPGGWALELAFRFPRAEIIGIDISPSVVEYANAQAWSRGLSNVHFQVGNVMEPLPFPDRSFDLINGRALCSFMAPAAWPRLLAECFRLLKPGGILRCTEAEQPLTTSPTFEHFCSLGTQALKRAGQSFSPDGRHVGITPVLPRLIRQAGFEQVRLRASVIEWSMGTEGHYPVFKDFLVAMDLVKPFLLKMGIADKETLEALYQQAIAEMQAEDFCALWTLLTVWGQKPTSDILRETSLAAG
ncbi:class I SAM-dependent methyltransferase [Thermogemmatispora sp.]|uniref:class I SAM-dependent methyltransferase n=1 Tax=Thermogemmatispora sp. TaxID=1968838 RepID=UPI001D2A1F3E|nr:class I SAM-dependent methyltransferase [Thermogemmatispora sp.]MBX5450410.1 methyltransferase domain-containing protein [Thermogemmatispora sp.]